MKRILIARKDGTVSLMELVGDAVAEEEIEKLEQAEPGTILSWDKIDFDQLPQSREFRNAWTLSEQGGVTVDMEKAKEIHMDRIRAARAKLFPVLDVEFMVASERGNTDAMKNIASRKQTLRDLPRTFDLTNARTPEELEALWPPNLPRKE